MKKVIIVICSFLLMGFSGIRYYQFRMTEEQAQYHWKNLEAIKLIMDQSSLPHSQVKQVIGAIDSLQKDMQRGLSIDSTEAKKK